MRSGSSKAMLSIAALAAALAFGTAAHAVPISKCNAAKKKCIGKYIAAQMGCYSKAFGKSLAVDPACLAKGVAKITGAGKGCFDKNDAKNDGCTQVGDAASQLALADAMIDDVVTDLYAGYPAPIANKCLAGKVKCVGKKSAGLMGCEAKGNSAGFVDPTCTQKQRVKFDGAQAIPADPTKGCFPGLDGKGGCLTTGDAGAIETKVDAWVTDSVNAMEPVPPGPGCLGGVPNGTKDAGETCDPLAIAPNNACPNVNGTLFPCTASCGCACPSLVKFAANASDPNSILDTGWTGISHDSGIVSDGAISVTVSNCAGNGRPCGVCDLGGPVNNVNAGTGDIDDERCSGNTSVRCNTDADCPGAGTCEIFFGSLLPLSAGGVSTCVENRVVGSLTGTANIETGASATTLNLNAQVWLGLTLDNPCPRCLGDGALNDGTQGGTCSGGARNGLPCDANGTHALGTTSLDCPVALNGSSNIANLPVPLQSTTGTATRTLSAANPNCRALGFTTNKCFCDTCNNAVATPCSTNADCTAVGATVCAGKRCVGGTNNGAPCSVASECPSGGFCQVPGTATAPNACNPPDGAPDGCQPMGGDEGECVDGPLDQNCAAPEQHRGCTIPTQAVDCPITSNCVPKNRECFLDNGVIGGQIVATGAADAPVNDVSTPKLATTFCVGFTGASSVNSTAGLPGPGRLTLKGQAAALD